MWSRARRLQDNKINFMSTSGKVLLAVMCYNKMKKHERRAQEVYEELDEAVHGLDREEFHQYAELTTKVDLLANQKEEAHEILSHQSQV